MPTLVEARALTDRFQALIRRKTPISMRGSLMPRRACSHPSRTAPGRTRSPWRLPSRSLGPMVRQRGRSTSSRWSSGRCTVGPRSTSSKPDYSVPLDCVRPSSSLRQTQHSTPFDTGARLLAPQASVLEPPALARRMAMQAGRFSVEAAQGQDGASERTIGWGQVLARATGSGRTRAFYRPPGDLAPGRDRQAIPRAVAETG